MGACGWGRVLRGVERRGSQDGACAPDARALPQWAKAKNEDSLYLCCALEAKAEANIVYKYI